MAVLAIGAGRAVQTAPGGPDEPIPRDGLGPVARTVELAEGAPTSAREAPSSAQTPLGGARVRRNPPDPEGARRGGEPRSSAPGEPPPVHQHAGRAPRAPGGGSGRSSDPGPRGRMRGPDGAGRPATDRPTAGPHRRTAPARQPASLADTRRRPTADAASGVCQAVATRSRHRSVAGARRRAACRRGERGQRPRGGGPLGPCREARLARAGSPGG